MSYSVSVVQFAPDANKAAANALAESLGYGPNNLSIQLKHQNGSVWWGCHAWWLPDALPILDTIPPELNVITSVIEGGDSIAHWEAALAAHSLQVI